jgi:hypothetical protein
MGPEDTFLQRSSELILTRYSFEAFEVRRNRQTLYAVASRRVIEWRCRLLQCVSPLMGWPGRAQRFICWTVVGRRKAQAEFVAAQLLNADRPEGRATLGNFLARRGHTAEAEAEYKAALRLNHQIRRRASPCAIVLPLAARHSRGTLAAQIPIAEPAARPNRAHPPAISCLGAFRTPVAAARR